MAVAVVLQKPENGLDIMRIRKFSDRSREAISSTTSSAEEYTGALPSTNAWLHWNLLSSMVPSSR